jgi:hypothetical protein
MVENLSKIITLIVTNVIKVAGLYIGVRTFAHSPDHPDAIALAYSAFMMAGAQVSETAVIRFIERFFGVKS